MEGAIDQVRTEHSVEAAEYMKLVAPLLHDMTAELLKEMPDDPESFIASYCLNRVNLAKEDATKQQERFVSLGMRAGLRSCV